MFGGGFNAAKLKPQLKMAVGRIEILKNKKTALLKQSMRQVAQLLADSPPKEEKARIRAEALIRDDNLIEALEIIQLNCELLHERIKLIQYTKECPTDLVGVISTLIWSSHRVDVPELLLIRQQFKAKYGRQFEESAMKNLGGCLNERVVTKLSVEPPAAYLVQVYLEKICEEFEVSWTPSMKLTNFNDMIEPMKAPTGFSIPVAQGTGLGPKLSSVNTGIFDDNNRNDRDNDGGGGATMMIPPVAPSFHNATTTVTGIPYQPQQQQQQASLYSPSASTITTNFPITPTMNHLNMNKDHGHDEPDIVIPNGATAPPGSVIPSSSTVAATAADNSISDSATTTTTTNGGDDGSASKLKYDDIMARFNQLKK